jgi:hypothetical protein
VKKYRSDSEIFVVKMAKRILFNFVNNLFCCIKLGTSVQPSCTDVLPKQHRKQSLETYKTIRKRFLIVFFRPFRKTQLLDVCESLYMFSSFVFYVEYDDLADIYQKLDTVLYG